MQTRKIFTLITYNIFITSAIVKIIITYSIHIFNVKIQTEFYLWSRHPLKLTIYLVTFYSTLIDLSVHMLLKKVINNCNIM